MTEIQAVCFDGFESIVQITRGRRPFEALLKNQLNGPRGGLALTRKMHLRDVARELSVQIDPRELAALEVELQEECASTRLRPGMDTIWAALRRLRLKIGVCSNLAAPYEQSLLACLPGIPDALVLSFDIGLMKPQPEFFQRVIAELRLEPSEILFVGNGCDGGVSGARSIGMCALTTDQFVQRCSSQNVDQSPYEIADLIWRLKAAVGRVAIRTSLSRASMESGSSET